MTELSGILVIAHRDVVKLLRDRSRIVADFWGRAYRRASVLGPGSTR